MAYGTLAADTIQGSAGGSVPVDTVVNGTAKAWVTFTAATGATLQGFNVSSVTHNGTGDYTVNFTNALADGNYAVSGMTFVSSSTPSPTPISLRGTSTKSSTACRFGAAYSGGLTDDNQVAVAFFR